MKWFEYNQAFTNVEHKSDVEFQNTSLLNPHQELWDAYYIFPAQKMTML